MELFLKIIKLIIFIDLSKYYLNNLNNKYMSCKYKKI